MINCITPIIKTNFSILLSEKWNLDTIFVVITWSQISQWILCTKKHSLRNFYALPIFFGVCPYFETGSHQLSITWMIHLFATAVGTGSFNVIDTIHCPTNLIFCYVNISMDQAVRHLPLSEDSQVALERVLLWVCQFSLVSIIPPIPHTAIHVPQTLHIFNWHRHCHWKHFSWASDFLASSRTWV
jgi:hypothetical protein